MNEFIGQKMIARVLYIKINECVLKSHNEGENEKQEEISPSTYSPPDVPLDYRAKMNSLKRAEMNSLEKGKKKISPYFTSFFVLIADRPKTIKECR